MLIFINGPTDSSLSGGDKIAIELSEHLRKRGSTVCVVTPKEWHGYHFCKQKKGFCIISSFPGAGSRVRSPLLLPIVYIIRALMSILMLSRIKVTGFVFSSADVVCDVWPAWLISRSRKLKWAAAVYHLVTPPGNRPGRFSLSNMLSYVHQRLCLWLIARYATMIFTQNSFLKSELIKRFKIDPRRINVISGGVDIHTINNVRCRRKLYDACFLGRIHPTKGIFDVIRTWKYVCEHKRDARLVMIGGGPAIYFHEMRKRAKQLAVENNISISGFKAEEAKYNLLKASRLLVLPSYEEGIPLVFYEAMSCGLPVVTYYLPSYADIKDYIVKVPLGNVKKAADEIVRVLEDKDLARRLSDRGRKLANERTWDKVADYIISQIENYSS